MSAQDVMALRVRVQRPAHEPAAQRGCPAANEGMIRRYLLSSRRGFAVGVRVKKVSKTKIAVKASTSSEIKSVLRRLGVDPELAKGDQKKLVATDPEPSGSRISIASKAGKKSTAKKSTAKKTAKKS